MTNFKKALAVGVLAVISGYASAAPMFSFTEYGGFTDDVTQATYLNQVSPAGDLEHTAAPIYNTMQWGTGYPAGQGNPPSSLVLTTFQDSLAENTWTTISTLQHNNNVISGSTNWSGQNIWGRLIISDSDGGVQARLDSDEAITIGLTETPNQTNIANCAPPNPVLTACDDFFSFTEAGLASLNFFANDGSAWVAEFRLWNFLDSAVIGSTIYTGEELVSSLDVQVRVTQVSSVPEPATLGIFGLGLLGLGLAKRRKQNG